MDYSESCPHDLKGSFEFPHLIVPVDKAHPNKAFGNQYNGTIDQDHCTLYSFDISPSQAGKKCSLIWLFPEQKDLKSSSFEYSASSDDPIMEFWHLGQPVTEKTTW